MVHCHADVNGETSPDRHKFERILRYAFSDLIRQSFELCIPELCGYSL